MPLHAKLGVAATTRASFYVYNLPSDIAVLAEGVRKAKHLFRR
jgi:cysteine desulfurase/selenocysteine lyase